MKFYATFASLSLSRGTELKAPAIACDMPWWRSVVSIQHDDLFLIKKHKNIRFSEVTITLENLVESIVK
jgi:hypothetical protein